LKGFGGLWKGVGSLLLGAGPSHALYFATYEEVKERLTNTASTHSLMYVGSTAIAGAAATSIAELIMTPFDGNFVY
jgi:Mitochondrial carrier protein